MYTTSETVSNI